MNKNNTNSVWHSFYLGRCMKYILSFIFSLISLCFYAQSQLETAEKLIESKNYAKAESILSDYVSTHPNDLEAVELLGDAYGSQKKWEGAIKYYKQLVAKENTNANYHYKYGGAMGMHALEINKLKAFSLLDDIKTAFLTAAELDPNHIDVRWALVELYIQLPGIVGGSVSKSLDYANELEALSKVDGYLAKGYIYEYDDEPAKAEMYYKKAIEEGGSMTCYEKLTALYESQKQPTKAISNIEAAQIKHKRNALHYQLGKVAAEYNVELNKGATCLLTYIENYKVSDGVPKAWAYYRLAQIEKHKGDKTEALKHIEKAISELPKIKTFKEEKQAIMSL